MSFIFTLTHVFCVYVVCAFTCAVLFMCMCSYLSFLLCVCVCAHACFWLPLLIFFPCRSPQRSLPPSAQWFPMFSFLWNQLWKLCLPSATQRRQIVCTLHHCINTDTEKNWFKKVVFQIQIEWKLICVFSPRLADPLLCWPREGAAGGEGNSKKEIRI